MMVKEVDFFFFFAEETEQYHLELGMKRYFKHTVQMRWLKSVWARMSRSISLDDGRIAFKT